MIAIFQYTILLILTNMSELISSKLNFICLFIKVIKLFLIVASYITTVKYGQAAKPFALLYKIFQ